MTRILALLAPLVLAFAVAQAFGQTTPPPPQQPPKSSNESTQTNQNTQNQSTQQREANESIRRPRSRISRAAAQPNSNSRIKLKSGIKISRIKKIEI